MFDERIAHRRLVRGRIRAICAGFIQIAATARPDTRSARSKRWMLEGFARLADFGTDAEEMERGRVQAEAQFIYRCRPSAASAGKSDQLNAYNVFLDDPGGLRA